MYEPIVTKICLIASVFHEEKTLSQNWSVIVETKLVGGLSLCGFRIQKKLGNSKNNAPYLFSSIMVPAVFESEYQDRNQLVFAVYLFMEDTASRNSAKN